jgi:HEAT repeat protein
VVSSKPRTNPHARFLAQVNRNNREILDRCRWSREDAARVVPKLIDVLSCGDRLLVDEALRALFDIGTPAVAAAAKVRPLIASEFPITRQLAVITLGQIAHKKPKLCVQPMIEALEIDDCRNDAIRILAYLKTDAKPAVAALVRHYDTPDAKTRKAIVKAVAAIDGRSKRAAELFAKAAADRSKIVRQAAAALKSPTG